MVVTETIRDHPLRNTSIHRRFHCDIYPADRYCVIVLLFVYFVFPASLSGSLLLDWCAIISIQSGYCLSVTLSISGRARSLSMILGLFIAAAKKGKPTLLLRHPSLCPHSMLPVNTFPASCCSQMRRLSRGEKE